MLKRSELKRSGGLKQTGGLKSTKGLKSTGGLKSNSKLNQNKKINGKSKKQKDTDRAYFATTDRMRKENDQVCTGCPGNNSESLTHSHLIPRSRRPDLIAEYRNITYHCITCHDIWESVDRVQLLDYERNMLIIKELDNEYYQILLMKQDMYNKNK